MRGWGIISAIMIFRSILLASALAWGGSSIARPLNDGWTADGAPVTLPHCWNVEDGTDGPTDPNANNHDSVAGTGYARRKVVYRRDLPPATPGLKRYLRVHAASIHAVVKVDGHEIGRHAGAFTAFTFALPPDGKALEIEVDNFFDPDVPPIGGDFTMYGGLYRGVELIEAPPSRAFVAADGLFADELAAPADLPRYEFRADGFYVDGQKTFLKGVNYHQDREGKGWAISAEGARDGLNDKGLVAFDHKSVKPAYELYRRARNRPAAAPARMTVVATNDFQAAIDAVAAAGGGTVRVPPGDYVTGGVWLKSHVTLELSEGARLVSNGDLATYANRRAMVYAENAEDVALVGRGEVCGSGEKFPARDNASGRPFDVLFRTCRDFRIEGVRLTDSAAWTCSLRNCVRGVVRGVKIFSHANLNNDGLDIEASDLLVEACDIDADDDALCFKSNSPQFVGRNVRVRNCRLASNCNAIKFGTASYGAWRDVVIEDS